MVLLTRCLLTRCLLTPCRRIGRRLRSAGADRGSSVVELAVLAPTLMIMCMLILQFGLWFNARQAALAAAQAGATVARQEAADPAANWQADAQNAAATYYGDLHTGLLNDVAPSAYKGTGNTSTVYVTVKGQLGYSVFPFWALNLSISATAGGPVECFHGAGQVGCAP